MPTTQHHFSFPLRIFSDSLQGSAAPALHFEKSCKVQRSNSYPMIKRALAVRYKTPPQVCQKVNDRQTGLEGLHMVLG
jgi:hypothetical protein